jgi:phenylalanyl-tRNA synthetase beta chain
MQLLVELADAKPEGIAQTGDNKAPDIEVTFRYAQVKKILGMEIDRCDNILERLGFEKLGGNDMAAKFKVPSWRVNDATREVDLIEEVARINGYDKITPTLPSKCTAAEISHEERTLKKIRACLAACGLDEIQTSSLIGKPLLEKFGMTYDAAQAIELLNCDEHTMMRQTLAVSVLNCLKYNYDNGQKNFWAYEIGKTYFQVRPSAQKDTGVDEKRILAGVITGEINNSKWQVKMPTDFYTLKGVFEKLFEELGLAKRIRLSEGLPPSLHPYRGARVEILGQGKIGYFGQIHPILKDKMKLNQDAFLFELDLGALMAAVKQTTPRFKKLSRFPEVRRDLQFRVPKDKCYEDVLKLIKDARTVYVKNVEVFDVYGENMAFHITMQDENATLTDEIINAELDKIRAALGVL